MFFAMSLAVLLCVCFCSCTVSELISQNVSEVDFSEAKNIQITYNGHIYDTSLVFNGNKLEFNFSNEKDAIGGAYIGIDSENYRITYSDMSFEGVTNTLPSNFLPLIVYSFFVENGSLIILDSYNEEKDCVYSSFSVSSYFLTVEVYENASGKNTLAMTIS